MVMHVMAARVVQWLRRLAALIHSSESGRFWVYKVLPEARFDGVKPWVSKNLYRIVKKN